MIKKILLLTLFFMSLPFFLIAGIAGYIIAEIYIGDDTYLSKENIVNILSKETLIYYDDNTTQLGSLFSDEHRQYVPLIEIPKYMLHAIVASEDDKFYTHPGIDPISTMRAIYRNFTTHKQEGASTITQQAIKNMYGRNTTGIKMKFKEGINALKLERKYKKDEILEFYLNQFHVVGNGRGIGIAAKYYFNKNTMDLTLTEAAFIAGSVKAPNKYVPFGKFSEEAINKAKEYAKNRKNYVLRRMFELNFINKEEFEKAKIEEVPFNQGKFQFNEISILEVLKKQLSKKEILNALNVEKFEQLSNMGLKITTTLSKNLQKNTLYYVRKNLNRLDYMLRGFESQNKEAYVPIQQPEEKEFYVTKLINIENSDKNENITATLGRYICKIPTDSIMKVAEYVAKNNLKGLQYSKNMILNNIKQNGYFVISVRKIQENNKLICDLEKKSKIQGGLIVMDKGKIKAMIGGFSSNEYNRAAFAQRQPGSTFKILTFYPALQLGWNILDKLNNTRSIHKWHDIFYYPRPDHKPKSFLINFLEATATSENLASVWLFNHLLDNISFEKFIEILKLLNIYEDGISGTTLLEKIKKEFKIKMTDNELKEGIFNQVRNEILQKYSNLTLQNMSYGANFDDEIERLNKNTKIPINERNIRLTAINNNFLNHEKKIGIYNNINIDGNSEITKETSIQEVISPDIIRNIRQEINIRFEKIIQGDILEKLFVHKTFRYSLSMYYAQTICKYMGIDSKIERVPSYPLGVNIVTLNELALAYQTIQSGTIYNYYGEEKTNQSTLIEHIEDSNGMIKWQAEPKAHQLVNEELSAQMFSIMRGTVTHGTAYAAHNAILLRSYDETANKELEKAHLRYPTFGKTGTTNNYVNATYIGFLPYPDDENLNELSRSNIYTIAAYVGFDDNKPMKNSTIRIAGGTGALPVWIDVANFLIKEEQFAEKLNWQNFIKNKLSEIPFNYGKEISIIKDINDDKSLNDDFDDYAVHEMKSINTKTINTKNNIKHVYLFNNYIHKNKEETPIDIIENIKIKETTKPEELINDNEEENDPE